MRAQSVSSRVIIVSLSILVLIVVGVFFMTNFGQASSDVKTIENNQAQCQTKCQNLITIAFNFNTCDDFMLNQNVVSYLDACVDTYGQCTVTVKDSVTCIIQ